MYNDYVWQLLKFDDFVICRFLTNFHERVLYPLSVYGWNKGIQIEFFLFVVKCIPLMKRWGGNRYLLQTITIFELYCFKTCTDYKPALSLPKYFGSSRVSPVYWKCIRLLVQQLTVTVFELEPWNSEHTVKWGDLDMLGRRYFPKLKL